MALYQVKNFQRIADIEAAFEPLIASKATQLRLQSNLTHAQFGGVAAMIQLIATWARLREPVEIRTYVDHAKDLDEQLRKLVREDHTLAATLLSDDVTARDGRTSIRPKAFEAALQRLSHLHSVQPTKRASNRPVSQFVEQFGHHVTLLCPDHTGRATPSILYNHPPNANPEVRPLEHFVDLTRIILRQIQSGSNIRNLSREEITQLASIIHEAFKNTHDWARHDALGRQYDKSLRMVRVEWYNHEHRIHLDMAETDSMLQKFLGHLDRGPEQLSRYLEVSVIDTGPGLAARRYTRSPSGTQTQINIDLEYKAVTDCFAKHITTSLDGHRGIGLHLIQSMLTRLGGFLRLRSGRLSLARDFVTHPYNPQADNEPVLFDWQSEGSRPVARPHVAGTVLTMFIPMDRHG